MNENRPNRNERGLAVKRNPVRNRMSRAMVWTGLRLAVPGALLLQLTNCTATNTELLIYQYEVALRNLVVNLIGAVISSVI